MSKNLAHFRVWCRTDHADEVFDRKMHDDVLLDYSLYKRKEGIEERCQFEITVRRIPIKGEVKAN